MALAVISVMNVNKTSEMRLNQDSQIRIEGVARSRVDAKTKADWSRALIGELIDKGNRQTLFEYSIACGHLSSRVSSKSEMKRQAFERWVFFSFHLSFFLDLKLSEQWIIILLKE